MEQSNSSLLQEIFALESAEDWKNTSEHYESLYSSVHTNEVAIHFAFFCWYLLWQWDEICFPGEESMSIYERPNAETRNGISKSLFSNLDLTTSQLLTSWESVPPKYLVVLALMKKIYPYFFRESTFSETLEQNLLNFISHNFFNELGVRTIYNYIQTQDSEHLTANEKMAINSLFPKGSLIQSYFTWLFS